MTANYGAAIQYILYFQGFSAISCSVGSFRAESLEVRALVGSLAVETFVVASVLRIFDSFSSRDFVEPCGADGAVDDRSSGVVWIVS
jgi:hypothetical protein